MKLPHSRSFGTRAPHHPNTLTDGIVFFFIGLIMEGTVETVSLLWASAKIKHVGFSFSSGTKQQSDIINICLLRDKCVSLWV